MERGLIIYTALRFWVPGGEKFEITRGTFDVCIGMCNDVARPREQRSLYSLRHTTCAVWNASRMRSFNMCLDGRRLVFAAPGKEQQWRAQNPSGGSLRSRTVAPLKVSVNP